MALSGSSNQKVLIAFDKFKGSISAKDASSVVASVLTQEKSALQIVELPIADGGDGTLDILWDHDFTQVETEVVGALLNPQLGRYALSRDGGMAFIEMASTCGIAELNLLDAFGASSFGLGIAARHAISCGATQIIISLGGSASTDGGLGLLMGLGAIARNDGGEEITPNLEGLKEISHLETEKIPSGITWTFLADVENPLVGENGAAHIFGKQKGMSDADATFADNLLNNWADLLVTKSGKDIRSVPGSGAAGGVAAAGIAILGGHVEPGSLWLAKLVGLEEAIAQSDVVITGEGSFDEQSFMGKGPGLVIELAKKYKKKIYVIAGRVDPSHMKDISYISLSELAPSQDAAFTQPIHWLQEAASELAVILDV